MVRRGAWTPEGVGDGHLGLLPARAPPRPGQAPPHPKALGLARCANRRAGRALLPRPRQSHFRLHNPIVQVTTGGLLVGWGEEGVMRTRLPATFPWLSALGWRGRRRGLLIAWRRSPPQQADTDSYQPIEFHLTPRQRGTQVAWIPRERGRQPRVGPSRRSPDGGRRQVSGESAVGSSRARVIFLWSSVDVTRGTQATRGRSKLVGADRDTTSTLPTLLLIAIGVQIV